MTPELVLNAKKLTVDIKAALKEEGLKYHHLYTLNGKKYYKMKFYGIHSINFTNVVDIKRKVSKIAKNLNNSCEIEAEFSLNLSGVLSLYVHVVREGYVHDKETMARYYTKTAATLHIDKVIEIVSQRLRSDKCDMLPDLMREIFKVECVSLDNSGNPTAKNKRAVAFQICTTTDYAGGIAALDDEKSK